MEESPLLFNVSIVLVRPRVAENIGAAARIAHNMGIKRIFLVRSELPEREAMAKMATHKAAHLIDSMALFPTLADALADYSMVVGTTARHGRQRCIPRSPRDTVQDLIPFLQENKTALVFGPEDTGLTNDEIGLCNFATSIPTADFSSLNLAQAVAILCYELYYGIQYCNRTPQTAPKMASVFELESMYSYLERCLRKIDFLNDDNKQNQMYSIRQFTKRLKVSSRESSIIRGICKAYLHHKEPGG